MSRTVLVIGATGALARPVIRQLITAGYHVRALVRKSSAARGRLPEAVTLAEGSLEQRDALQRALAGSDALYLNLPATTMPLTGFVPERDGMRNILQALADRPPTPILKLSEIDAEHHGAFLDLRLKFESEQQIKEAGHPYIIFRPTWFMESLPDLLMRGHSVIVAGRQAHPVYWIAGDDYGRMVAAALQLPAERMSRTYTIQGPEPLTIDEVAALYRRIAEPRLRTLHIPLWLLGIPAAVSPAWRFNKQLMAFYNARHEIFAGEEAWNALGRPRITMADFAQSRVGAHAGHSAGE